MSVYFFLHIPKTAGITIAEHLEENCPPGWFWRPPAPRLLGGIGELPDFERIRAVAPGHYRGQSLERYFAGREIRRIVLLRDPIGLQLSYYNWRMLRFLSRGRRTYGLWLHLRSLPRNFMTVFLLRNWLEIPWSRISLMSDCAKIELLQNHFSRFWFVGAHTDSTRLIEMLAPELDVPPTPARRNSSEEWRTVVDWRPLSSSELSPALRQEILFNNPLDQLLWETWQRAGFNAAQVRPAILPGHGFWQGWGHRLTRPPLELFRLYRRGPARWPDMPKIGLPLLAGEPREPNRLPLADLIAALIRAPSDASLWRAYLTRVRCRRPARALPSSAIGSPSALQDHALCLLKGEALACGGQERQARPFLRLAPSLARNRSLARDTTIRAASFDRECAALVRLALAARNRGDWPEAARLYRAALDLYPGHCNFMVEYAHCLRAQHDWIGAEIYYRSSRALGAWLKDMQAQLVEVAARLDYAEPITGGWAKRPRLDSISVLDDPPTRADVEVAAYVVTGTPAGGNQHILELLRSAENIRDLVRATIAGYDTDGGVGPPPATIEAGCQRFIEMRRALALASLIAIADGDSAAAYGADARRVPTPVLV
jgi:tetratricopeptide (TPR) repeat protein